MSEVSLTGSFFFNTGFHLNSWSWTEPRRFLPKGEKLPDFFDNGWHVCVYQEANGNRFLGMAETGSFGCVGWIPANTLYIKVDVDGFFMDPRGKVFKLE